MASNNSDDTARNKPQPSNHLKTGGRFSVLLAADGGGADAEEDHRDKKQKTIESDDGNCDHVFLWPLILPFLQHREVRSLCTVSKGWQKAVAQFLAQFPTIRMESKVDFVSTLRQHVICAYDPSGIMPGAIFFKAQDIGLDLPMHRVAFGGNAIESLNKIRWEERGVFRGGRLSPLTQDDLMRITAKRDHRIARNVKVGDRLRLVRMNKQAIHFSMEDIFSFYFGVGRFRDSGKLNKWEFFAHVISLDSTNSLVNLELEIACVESSYSNGSYSNGHHECKIERNTDHVDKFQNNPIPEGAVWNDFVVSDVLVNSLNTHIDEFAVAQDEPDYNPGSNNTVRDYIHPALFAYVHGTSRIEVAGEDMLGHFRPREWMKDGRLCDMLQRKYEDSQFQWLPSWFTVLSEQCTVRIEGDINGLSRGQYPDLYEDIESLFGLFVPRIEAVYSYIRSVSFCGEYDYYDKRIIDKEDEGRRSGAGRVSMREGVPSRTSKSCQRPNFTDYSRLQVISKIVDYELQPGQSYEGVWHVEGMPHEHIIATCLYILDRDGSIQGGDILFKRAFSNAEWKTAHGFSTNDGDSYTFNLAEGGVRPIGRVATPKGRMIVFPNSHIHKVEKMTNIHETELARRRIVVFFVIDPVYRVISTHEVPNQRKHISLEKAKEFRSKLMHERKYHKQNWNVRPVSLCEH